MGRSPRTLVQQCCSRTGRSLAGGLGAGTRLTASARLGEDRTSTATGGGGDGGEHGDLT